MRLNDREISFTTYSTDGPWLRDLPDQNWLCILVVDDTSRRNVEAVLHKLLLKDVCWLCTVGHQCELVHDLMDEEIAYRQSVTPQPYLPKHLVMTTWHDDFEEGVWFAVYTANHNDATINRVVVLDITNGAEQARIEAALAQTQKED